MVVLGGGRNDSWHNLACKGKYAGEIRIEITYYDTRPKQEKLEKAKQVGTNGVDEGSKDSLRGPRQPKAPVKRRPLPSDPITGAPAVTIPDHVQIPPRGYPPSPAAVSEHVHTPTRSYQNPIPVYPEHVSTPPQHHQSHSTVAQDYMQTPPRGYQTPPTAIPDHVQPSQRSYTSPSFIPNQSPLQSVEYSTPPQLPTSQAYDSGRKSNGYGTPSRPNPGSQVSREMSYDKYDTYDPMARIEYAPSNENSHYDEEPEDVDLRDHYQSQRNPYELPQQDDFDSPPSPGGPPPPPPVHRSRAGSSQPIPAPGLSSHDTYGYPSESRQRNQYNTPLHEAHRHSAPDYTQSNTYQAYTPDQEQDQIHESAMSNDIHQQSPPRHHSYDSRYNVDYGSMQPTVEDAPPSPNSRYSGRRESGSRISQFEDRRYDKVPSPAPLNLSGRGSSSSGRNSVSTAPTHQYSTSSLGYGSGNSQLSYSDRSQTEFSTSSRTSYNAQSQPDQRSRGQSEDPIANYGLHPVPATLVPGMDPVIAQEIADRIYDEKRASYSNGLSNSARGRYQASPQYQPHTRQLSHHEATSPSYDTPNPIYDDHQSRFSSAATVPVQKPRAISPDPRIMRKSVSPSPGPPDNRDNRRLSGVPFGPDSYAVLNPSISGSTSTPSLSAAYDIKDDIDAKIIGHDGREIDPSDHIPESNYAPLLETKGPKYASQQPDRNARNIHQPRRPLKVAAARPQSMAAYTAPVYMNNGPPDLSTPPNAQRNRLQKKVNRMSAQPAPQSRPLAPISPYQHNTPRSLPRAHTTDFSENYAAGYGGSSQEYRNSAGPPLIPAKVPMGMTGPSQSPHASGGDAWALLEEMKSIDLGSGRARRRGGY